MRTILRGLGWTVLGLVAFVVACNVVNRGGPEWGIAISTLFAAFAASDQARALVDLFREALAECRISQDAFAIDYGTTKSQVSNAFAHREQLSFHRAANVDRRVWRAFARKLLAQDGDVVFDRGVAADLAMALLGQAEAFRNMVEPPRPQLAFSADRKVSA